MDKNSKIFVAGHRGLVGSAIVRKLKESGFQNLIYKTRAELDLTSQSQTNSFFEKEKPEYVFMAAAKVGGIIANRDYPSEFFFENAMIGLNTLNAATSTPVKKFLFLGSSCIFPQLAPQPIVEASLLTGPLEPTNEAYAIAKIASLKYAEYLNRQHGKPFISVMPPNMYGPGDNFHPTHSHVIPGLMRRFHQAKLDGAKEVVVWGSGKPLREFLFVDDLADACLFLMQNYSEPEFINAGSGEEVSIRELAELIKTTVGFSGKIEFDSSKPDGTPRKVMDHSRIKALGWKARTTLAEGLRATYAWYLATDAHSKT